MKFPWSFVLSRSFQTSCLVWLFAAAVAGVCIAVYSPTFGHDFVFFDDDINIYSNPHLGPPAWSRLKWMLTDAAYVRRYMPIGWLSYAVVTAFTGLDPRGFHVACVFIHGVNTALIFGIGNHLVRRLGTKCGFGTALLANSVAALWWSLSPLRVESVAWASGLHYQVATFFLLLGLGLYFWADSATTGRIAWSCRAASALFYTFSLLTYPVMLGAVFMLVGYEVYRIAPSMPSFRSFTKELGKRIVGKQAFWWVACIAIGALTLTAKAGESDGWKVSITSPWYGRWLDLFYLLGHYCIVIIVPRRISPIYDTLISPDYLSWPILACYSVCFGAVIFLYYSFVKKWWAWLAVAIGFIGLLIPVAGLFQSVRYASDRYANAPALLLALGLGCLLARIPDVRWRRAVIGAIALITVFLLPATRRQIGIWHNTESLLSHALIFLNRPVDSRCAIVRRLALYRCAYKGDSQGALNLLDGELAKSPRPTDRARYEETRLQVLHSPLAPAGKFVPVQSRDLFHFATTLDIPAQDYTVAAIRLEQALRWAPDYSDARFCLALVLLMSGDIQSSWQNYQLVSSDKFLSASEKERGAYVETVRRAFASLGESLPNSNGQ